MTKISKINNGFNKSNLKILSEEIIALINEHLPEGMNVADVGGSFYDGEFTWKIKFKLEGVKTFGDHILESEAKKHGFVLENRFGEKLIEYKARNYKMPYIYMTRDGNRYKASLEVIKRKFAA